MASGVFVCLCYNNPMPARDKYHDAVRNALIKDGWTITHDPFHLQWGRSNMFVDLGAERLVAAEKEGQKIAIEIKGFAGPSELTELERAIGQFTLYQAVLAKREPDYVLYLAVPQETLKDVFQEALGLLLIENGLARVIGFDPEREEIVQWIN